MTCRHCRHPIQRCPKSGDRAHFLDCRGWLHARDGMHSCEDMQQSAEPEPGQLPAVQAPASKPDGAVA